MLRITVLTALLILCSIKPVSAQVQAELETKGNLEIIKVPVPVENAQSPEIHWIRMERTGNQLKFIPSSQMGGWSDHPMLKVVVKRPMCSEQPTVTTALSQIKADPKLSPSQSDIQRRQILDSFTTSNFNEPDPCLIQGINSLVLPVGMEPFAKTQYTVDYAQMSRLWHVTFTLESTLVGGEKRIQVLTNNLWR